MDADAEQPPPTPTLDADSLRAAALLSRKRRRVVADAPALPPRLAPEPTFQLDYGDNDSTTVLNSQRPPPPPAASEPNPGDIEDGQIREEGEISDTEASPPRRSPTPPPRLRQRPFPSQPQEPARIETPLALSHIEPPTPSPLEPSPAQSWQPASAEPFMLETSTYRIDAHHVRPGLAMNVNQYNAAKDIVLDLLGWGVPPEYLLECGLSRHVIFYVFSELNLRLPSNLDTSGLISYPTPEMLALMPISPSPSTRSLHSSTSTMPPPSVIPTRVSLVERMSMEFDARMSSPDPSPYIKAEPSSPSSADLSNSSLLMIEQQRRQELLARKAVIASRRSRQSEPPGFATPTRDEDIDMSAVHAQSVDDFLKSIEPAPPPSTGDSNSQDQRSSVGANSFSSLEHMDSEDLIPGLVGVPRNTSTSLQRLSQQPDAFSDTAVHPELRLPALSVDNTGFASSGTEQGSAISMDTLGSDSHTPTIHGNPSYPSFEGDSSHPQRRGVKRPVAADFVDFDSHTGTSRGTGSSSSNGHPNGGPYPNSLRRKAGSFAGISGMRRCVIELSDSEDDGDSHAMGDQVGNGDIREYSPAVTTARVPPRLTATPTLTSYSGLSAVANGNTGQPLLTAATTNALAEKEEEIKKMRQLIAQREELRLKKLVAMSGKSTPPAAEIPTPEGSVVVKQDEARAGSVGRNNSSTQPHLRDRENTHPSILESTRRHGISVPVANGNPDTACDNSANVRTLGISGSTGGRSGMSAQEASTIGSLSRFSDTNDPGKTESLTMSKVLPSEEDIHQESLAAGDSGVSSSAQVRFQLPQSRNEAPPPLSRSGFPLYDSPLCRYPLLRPRFGPDSSAGNASFVALPSMITRASRASAHSTSPTSVQFPSLISCGTGAVTSHPSSPIPLPDLKELKQAVLHRWFAQITGRSPDLRVCPYEVPGGGVCRDKDCGELHLSRIDREPSDTEVAAYVHGNLPHPWKGRCDVRAIEIALEGVRLRGGATDVVARAREALGGLGIPMT